MTTALTTKAKTPIIRRPRPTNGAGSSFNVLFVSPGPALEADDSGLLGEFVCVPGTGCTLGRGDAAELSFKGDAGSVELVGLEFVPAWPDTGTSSGAVEWMDVGLTSSGWSATDGCGVGATCGVTWGTITADIAGKTENRLTESKRA